MVEMMKKAIDNNNPMNPIYVPKIPSFEGSDHFDHWFFVGINLII
jgi:hypothetical protein